MRVIGVDGCRGGWVAAALDTECRAISPAFHSSLGEIVGSYPDAACIAIDIPIGLTDGPPRECDVAARRMLGRPRGSSVFPAPPRPLLSLPTYAEALARSREWFGRGISVQAFAIYPRIAEADAVMTPELQDRVIEAHPEVAFTALAGGHPMANGKKSQAGFDERSALLASAFPNAGIPQTRADSRRVAPFAASDDLLDALVLIWVASRVASGVAKRLPERPPIDARGLRMEIVY